MRLAIDFLILNINAENLLASLDILVKVVGNNGPV